MTTNISSKFIQKKKCNASLILNNKIFGILDFFRFKNITIHHRNLLNIYSKKSIVLALTNSHGSSSTGVVRATEQRDFIRCHQTRLLVRRQEGRESSI